MVEAGLRVGLRFYFMSHQDRRTYKRDCCTTEAERLHGYVITCPPCPPPPPSSPSPVLQGQARSLAQYFPDCCMHGAKVVSKVRSTK